ncbi:DUF4288 domain-containing protein [Methylobacterium sp. 22177]|uniref:DUF4288 domain-containing protein n=1 Tax=Methylobacterium sp. 22177 TaxID=3453885 RepID=UPI003F838F8E
MSLLSECRVAGAIPHAPLRKLAIHIVNAQDEAEACVRDAEIGLQRQNKFRNMNGEDAASIFQRVVECQTLYDRDLADGMEVSSWLYEGERLCLNDGWLAQSPEPS